MIWYIASYTLQELKLQGTKIRDGVVFSRYSRAQCFAIKLSNFGGVAQLVEHRIGNQQVPGSAPGLGSHLNYYYSIVVLNSGH